MPQAATATAADSLRDKSAIAQENYAAYELYRDAGHDKYVEIAAKCDRFVLGDQWDEKDEARLRSEGRPALTINLIASIVKTVLGQQTSQRADITFKPKRGTTQKNAEALTKLVLHIQEDTKYGYKESQVYADGIIQDRGYFDIRMNFDESLQGDIVVNSEDPIDVIPDPGAKDYDPKTWRGVVKSRWMTLDEIAETYGEEKAKEAELSAMTGEFSHDAVRYNQKSFGDMDKVTAIIMHGVERQVRRVRVIERQYYKSTMSKVLVDPATMEMRPVPQKMDPKVLEQLVAQTGYSVINRRMRKVRWCVTAANTVLMDDWSPYRSFTIIPYFPFFRRGQSRGLVRDLLSPQEQHNKVESQLLHVVNTTANSGWSVEAGSLVNMTNEELEERGAETGLVVVHRRGRNAPKKIEPNRVPTGLDSISRGAADNLRTISGVGALLGAEGPEVSGIALRHKQGRGLVQLQPLADNLSLTRALVAEKFLELIQDFYTETRAFRITNWENRHQAEEELTINGLTPEGEVINDVTTGEYDVVVSSQPTRDTFEESQFAEALELRNAGVQIPDHHVIKNSHLADKLEIAEEIKQLQGLGELTEQQAQMQEMQMEAEIMGIQLALAEQKAKIAKLESEAEYWAARAANESEALPAEAERKGIETRMELENLRASMMRNQQNLQNKLELAQKHINANREKLMYAETSKRVGNYEKLRLTQEGANNAKPK